MLLRTGAGKVKHPSGKQPWDQGARQGYGVEVWKMHRAMHASDIMTHVGGESNIRRGFRRMGHHAPEEWLEHPWLCDSAWGTCAVVGPEAGAVWPTAGVGTAGASAGFSRVQTYQCSDGWERKSGA